MTDYVHKDNSSITATIESTDLSLLLYRAGPSDPVPGQIRAKLTVEMQVTGGYVQTEILEDAVENFMDAGQFTTWKQLTGLVKNGLIAKKLNAQ